MIRQATSNLMATLAAGLLGFPPAIFAQLPSESTLPGRPVKQSTMPDESTLPSGYMIAPSAVDDSPPEKAVEPGLPTRPVQSQESAKAEVVSKVNSPTDRILPGESILPAAASQKPDPETKQRGRKADDVMNLGQSPDGIPWLRLEMRGHTSPVRSLVFTADGKRLCSAGDDKQVIVWGRDVEGQWRYERTIRWQVQRGNRGRIYALASQDNLIALGGHGAMGGLGEILLVNAITGNLRAALYDEDKGHRQVIVSMAFSPDLQRPGLASMDRAGRALYWQPDPQTGFWRPKEIQPPDTANYGAALAKRLFQRRGISPLVMVDGQHVVLPVHVNDPRRRRGIAWQLEKINVNTGQRTRWPGQQGVLHTETLSALAATPDGTRLASADAAGRLMLWDRGGIVGQRRLSRACISLALDDHGETLVAGTARSRDGESARVQVWDVSNPDRWRERHADMPTSLDVYACTVSRDGQSWAYAIGSDVHVRAPGRKEVSRLATAVRPPLRVAFAKSSPFYRIAIGWRSQNDRIALEQMFDTNDLQLGTEAGDRDESKWISNTWLASGWDVQVVRDQRDSVESYRLTHRGELKGLIPFDPSIHGAPSAWCWIPQRDGQPFAVAVGTGGDNNIHVFRLAESGTCPLLRVLRGHAGRVTSVCVSRDLRYLVSSSLDATIRVWSIGGLHDEDPLINRWGATFDTRDGQLRVLSVREDGPLYFRGMREGDVIRRLRWSDTDAEGVNQQRESNDAAHMLRVLRQMLFDTSFAFDYVRGRMPQQSFQMVPAWQPLVSLIVSEDRQWAYWSPTGHYDASFEGHKLFGWQVNRGLTMLPDFFLATQLRAALEHPEVMSQLLDAGSIDSAFRLGQMVRPANPQRALVDAIHLRPRIEILSPKAGNVVQGESVQVTAAVSIANGQRLVPPKLFANGVVGQDLQLKRVESHAGGQRLTYQWQAALPSEQQILLQVVAATESEVAGSESVRITRDLPPNRRKPRMFVATAGVNRYLDSQLPELEFAVNNAKRVASMLHDRASSLYGIQAISLSDAGVTRSAWNAALQQYADELTANAHPDDLLVLFLSGHGLRDQQTDKYYYLAANARYQDIMGRRYSDCLSLEDFALFADVPCRKLVVLDTCHSGALQPLRQRELKAALRALQDDLVFTLTASEGGQEAVEERERKLGRFTSRLLEAMHGAADREDGNGNGIVSWREIVDYVQRKVTADSLGDEFQQYPMAGPRELLTVADFPLTTTGLQPEVALQQLTKHGGASVSGSH